MSLSFDLIFKVTGSKCKNPILVNQDGKIVTDAQTCNLACTDPMNPDGIPKTKLV